MISARRARIFVSYSHHGNGNQWKQALLDSLRIFEQHHLLDVWQDEGIRVSAMWDDTIRDAMEAAKFVIFLLTPKVLESPFICGTELPVIRERWNAGQSLPVLPIVCEPCDWENHPATAWLGAFQAPAGKTPLSSIHPDEIKGVWEKLATDIAERLSEVALAELPEPPLPLSSREVEVTRLPQSNTQQLIGREQELALLDLAFAQDATKILALEAWGGVGKTALIQHWLNRLQRERGYGAERVFAWSFHSQGSSDSRQAGEDAFLNESLRWFQMPFNEAIGPEDKGQLLADAVAKHRTLLILDGMEPLQHPPGIRGAIPGQLHAPGVLRLLKRLARGGHLGLCILTTREHVSDLSDFERSRQVRNGSVLRVNLGNLSAEAGACLLHHAGADHAGVTLIDQDHHELRAASDELNGHALTLFLLGRYLARAFRGDILQRGVVSFADADASLRAGQAFQMIKTYEHWLAAAGELGLRQVAVLRLLGLFDRPCEPDCVNALRAAPVITGLTDHLSGVSRQDWNVIISGLRDDLGLITTSEPSVGSFSRDLTLDAHPLVREYFARSLRDLAPEAARAAHQRLFDYLRASVQDQPETMIELQALYQAVSHGCQAGVHRVALDDVFQRRIRRRSDYSWRHHGAFTNDVAAISCFFTVRWTKIVDSVPDHDQAWLLNEASFCLRGLGRLEEAEEAVRDLLVRDVRHREWGNASMSATQLTELLLLSGQINEALGVAKQAVEYGVKAGDPQRLSFRQAVFADASWQAGDRENAQLYFERAERSQGSELCGLSGFQFHDLLLADAQNAAWRSFMQLPIKSTPSALGKACTEVIQRINRAEPRSSGIFDRGNNDLSRARGLIYQVLNKSAPTFTIENALHEAEEALRKLRNAGVQEHTVRGLLTRAWLNAILGKHDAARHDLDDAEEMARRGPMRLHLSDVLLYRARIQKCTRSLSQARELIRVCNYNRRKVELADAVEAARLWS